MADTPADLLRACLGDGGMSAPADRAAELREPDRRGEPRLLRPGPADGRGRRLRRLDARARGAGDGAPRAGDARLAHPARGGGAVPALRPRRAPAPHAQPGQRPRRRRAHGLARPRPPGDGAGGHGLARRSTSWWSRRSTAWRSRWSTRTACFVQRRHPRRRRRGRGRDRQPAHDPRHPHPAAAAGRRRRRRRGGGARRGVPAARGVRGAQRDARRRRPADVRQPAQLRRRQPAPDRPEGHRRAARCRSGATAIGHAEGLELPASRRPWTGCATRASA